MSAKYCDKCGVIVGTINHKENCPELVSKPLARDIIFKTEDDVNKVLSQCFKFYELGYEYAIKTLQLGRALRDNKVESMKEFFERIAKEEGIL